jgi:hypothetical protein
MFLGVIAGSSAMHTIYSFGPFRFESDLEIAELRDFPAEAGRPVRIRQGVTPSELADAVSPDRFVQLTPTEYLLSIPDVARYHVRNGDEVTIEAAAGAPAANITTYLLGSVFGALCHQNGLLPLHASAVASGNSIAAFLGDSGAGKSTLAAWLQRRGHTIVADDICLIDPSAGIPQVIPVAGWLKLWNQSLEHLGEAPNEQHRVFSTDDKFRVFLPPASPVARHLGRLVFLERTPSAEASPALIPMAIPEAVAALMDMTYAVYIPVLTGRQPELFRTCAALLREAQPFRLVRPWSLERFDDVLDLLEDGVLAPAPEIT